MQTIEVHDDFSFDQDYHNYHAKIEGGKLTYFGPCPYVRGSACPLYKGHGKTGTRLEVVNG